MKKKSAFIALAAAVLLTLTPARVVAQVAASAPAPSAGEIPHGTILMDGLTGDWYGVEPVLRRGSGDQPPPPPFQAIEAVYLCRDAAFLYMRFDLADGRPPAPPAYPLIYEVEVLLAESDLLWIQFAWTGGRAWEAVIGRRLRADYTKLADGSLATTPKGFEGAFPLSALQAWIEEGRGFPYAAKAAYQKPGASWAEARMAATADLRSVSDPRETVPAAPAAPAVSAVQPAPQAEPWNAGVQLGSLIDILGYALITGGGAVMPYAYLDDFVLPLGLGMMRIGSVCMTGGGLLWNASLDQRHAAYRQRGWAVPESPRSVAWALSWLSVGCQAGSFLVPLLIKDDWGKIISGLVLLGLAACVEAGNTFGPRMEWEVGLNAADPAKKAAVRPPG